MLENLKNNNNWYKTKNIINNLKKNPKELCLNWFFIFKFSNSLIINSLYYILYMKRCDVGCLCFVDSRWRHLLLTLTWIIEMFNIGALLLRLMGLCASGGEYVCALLCRNGFVPVSGSIVGGSHESSYINSSISCGNEVG